MTFFGREEREAAVRGRVSVAAALCLGAMLWVCLGARAAAAQVVDASQWQSGGVDLTSGWRTHVGDEMKWAQLGFDDSEWKTVELDDLGRAQLGWRWFRLHVKLAPGHAHEHLLIVGGTGVYALYLNGLQVEDAQLAPWYALKRPVEQVISLPDNQDDFTIALRTHADSTYTMWHLPLFLTVAMGTPDVIDNERASFESQRLYQALPSLSINLLLMLAGLGAFALYRSQRAHQEYLWLGFYLFLLGLSNGVLFSVEAGLAPIAWSTLLADPLIYFFTIMQIEFTFSFAGRRVGRIWRTYECGLLLMLVLIAPEFIGVLPNAIYVGLEALMILPAALLLPVLLLVWYRRGNREAGWLILPSLLPAATEALFDIGVASTDVGWGRADFLTNPILLGPISLQVNDVGDFLFVLAIAVVMFFRFTRVSREQAHGAAELEAARELQQRLVPAQLPEIAGYALEAAYWPAHEVGGDFYQLLDQGDGMRLVVVGDVSGKGLKAAMTGTLAMGALLMRLNRQLAATGDGGFITCVCVRLGADGEVTAANAGHVSPYRNGEEMLLDAGLPLGISCEAKYVDQGFRLGPGDRLALMSDGVVEARDARGALFGFDRTRAISAQPAEAIAAAAREHGQEDDITVLTLTRALAR